MAVSLASLPFEVISNHLLKYLTPGDVINVVRALDLDVSREIYNAAFHDNTHFKKYDRQMFEERAKSRYYVLWSNTSTKLCMEDEPIVQAQLKFGNVKILTAKGELRSGECSKNSSRVYDKSGEPSAKRVKRPYEMEKMELSQNNSYQGFNAKDDFDKTRSETRRVKWNRWLRAVKRGCKKDFFEMCSYQWIDGSSVRAEAVRGREEIEPLGPLPKGLLELSQKYFSVRRRPHNFVDMAHGTNFVGVDHSGILWMFDSVEYYYYLFPFCLVDMTSGDVITERLIKIVFEDYYLAVLVEGRGLLLGRLWYPAIQVTTTLRPNGVISGYQCFDDHLCYLEMGTKVSADWRNIRDFAILCGEAVIFLTKDGTIGGTSLVQTQGISFLHYIDEWNSFGPFSTIAAISDRDYGAFGLTTTDGRVVIVDLRLCGYLSQGDKIEWQANTHVVPDITGIVSLAFGEEHCLFLSEEGEVYVLDDHKYTHRYLGPKRYSTSEKLEQADKIVTGEYSSFAMGVPTKIQLPGKAYAVYACYKTSGVIIYEG